MIDDFKPASSSRRTPPSKGKALVAKPKSPMPLKVVSKKTFSDFSVSNRQRPVAATAKSAPAKSGKTVGDFVVKKELNTKKQPVEFKKSNVVSKSTKKAEPIISEPSLPQKAVVEKHVISRPPEGIGKQSRWATAGLSLFLFLLLSLPTGLVLRHWLSDKQQEQALSQTLGDAASQEIPFTPLYPAGLATQASDTPTYDFSEKVLRYTDRVGDVPVAISQQVLPENFKADSSGAEFEKFAKTEGANRTLKAGSYTFYLGSKPGAVNLVHFTDQKVMVTITTQSEIETVLWTEYLATFQPEAPSS